MTPETRAMIDRVRELDKAVSEAEWKVAKLEPTGAGRALTEHTRAEAVRIDLEREEYFRTAAPALADALEAAERDKAKLVKGMLETHGSFIAIQNQARIDDEYGLISFAAQRVKDMMDVFQSIGIESIEAARVVAEGINND